MWRIFKPGCIPYAQALMLQDLAREQVRLASQTGFLFALQHPPVITMGRRSNAQDLLLPPEAIRAQGGEVFTVRRGGLATAHEPGQLVVYPVVSLAALKLSASAFMEEMETAMLEALQQLGAQVFRREGHRGVFSHHGKAGSTGVSVQDNIVSHGLAINVENNLQAFSWIVPCGLVSEPITTLRALGVQAAMPEVETAVLTALQAHFPLPEEHRAPWLNINAELTISHLNLSENHPSPPDHPPPSLLSFLENILVGTYCLTPQERESVNKLILRLEIGQTIDTKTLLSAISEKKFELLASLGVFKFV